MKRRRRGVVVDPSALSRKQARRKAEEKLKTVALQRDPERLNGSLNVSSPHRSNVSSFRCVGRGEGVTFTKWEFSSDGIKAEVDNRLSRIPNYVVIFSLPQMQFEGIMPADYLLCLLFLSNEREGGKGVESSTYRIGEMGYFARRFCVAPLRPFRSAGFTSSGGESRTRFRKWSVLWAEMEERGRRPLATACRERGWKGPPRCVIKIRNFVGRKFTFN